MSEEDSSLIKEIRGIVKAHKAEGAKHFEMEWMSYNTPSVTEDRAIKLKVTFK